MREQLTTLSVPAIAPRRPSDGNAADSWLAPGGTVRFGGSSAHQGLGDQDQTARAGSANAVASLHRLFGADADPHVWLVLMDTLHPLYLDDTLSHET